MGIILKESNGSYSVDDLVSIEHQERSMIDGQIHNILSVANVIAEIKELLEKKHGPLKRVSVAAAGRALKTAEGSMTIDISEHALMNVEDINRLELAAVQQAQQKLLSSDSMSKDEYYYCVGYSVLHYKLDGEEIGHLLDQTGQTASVDVIATFLPRVVVESLLSALKRAGLEMEALTLEPIAAINVLIPPSMRRLNVALVDIGAGTSDIAITDSNTVVAYGMVPIAGDEITEALSNHYLLDFPLAEQAKRSLSSGSDIVVTDILGFEQIVPSNEVISIIQPAIQRLAQSISNEIKRLNGGQSPKAVMVVGGGSLTPTLMKELSACLELPENRVAIRGLDALTNVTLATDIPSSPELVTPIGIAIAARRAPIHYMSVTVNDKTIRLFELKEMTVSDALLAANVKARQLYGRPGLGMSISVNDHDLIIPGEHGTPSIMRVNGQIANTKDRIADGDCIELLPGKEGRHASATLADVVKGSGTIDVTIDEVPLTLEPEITINGVIQPLETMLQDRDKIIIQEQHTLAAALEKLNRNDLLTLTTFTITLDGKPVAHTLKQVEFTANGTTIDTSYLLRNGDSITSEKKDKLTIGEVINHLGKKIADEITVTFNGETLLIQKQRIAITVNGHQASATDFIKVGDQLDLVTLQADPIRFSDIFTTSDYQLPKNTSGNYQLLRNTSPIGFNEPIFGGDALEIIFT
ncbi:rod shape-determining protein [Sporosarcina sp. ACRSM]|uniref:cell division protein FtsA n=1 Tax=Sporosarcina sp. ACRSM TaxID=2918216 RepID=UPI001EF50938|nr:rod shape-determining protein [Sporosarcina sp. ACRSM]